MKLDLDPETLENLMRQQPDTLPAKEIPMGPYLLGSPSQFASTARWIDFRERGLVPMIDSLPEDEFLRAMRVCIDDMLAWRAEIPLRERFWKADA